MAIHPESLNMPRIYLSPPHLGGSEQQAIAEAIATNWITALGPQVDAFERTLSRLHGGRAVVAVISGTAALHLSTRLAGVQPGDEVICQSLTFAATANPIRYLGARPVFIDSEPDSWNLDPDLVAEAIVERRRAGARVKAVIAVHLYGMPARLDRLADVCRAHGVVLIEDGASSLGSLWDGQAVGTFGEFGIVSFNGNKIITTSGGGALIASDPARIEEARYLANQARDPAPHYQHSTIGYNYRLSNLLGAFGNAQLALLDARVARRRAIFDGYRERLGDLPGVSFQPEPARARSNRWLSVILIDPGASGGITHESARLELERHDIESRLLWKPMHLQPVFADFPSYNRGVADGLFDRGLCLPSGSSLSDADLDRIAEILRRHWREHR
jgi:dTDP-4-amino-4,6-dideoxygalactose transaminase